MNFPTTSRHLNTDEVKILNSLLSKTEKEAKSKIKFHYYFIAGLLGSVCAYKASIIPDSIWTFLLGTISVFCFTFIVFTPYEIYKNNKLNRKFIETLQYFKNNETVETHKISALRIAIAPEFEDESDLYIIELEINKVLYIWDIDYNLKKKFPCLEFEIYEDKFYKLIGKQIYPLSEKIQPIKIDRQAKWNYMKKFGIFGQLEVENVNFDKLIEEYNNCA